MKSKFAIAEMSAGSWKLDKNDVWNIPPDTDSVRFKCETIGPWGLLLTLKALAVSFEGRVYGVRTMYRPVEGGHTQFGRISIGGKKCKAFTSSRLFEREDGSLCDVAVFII